MSAMVKKEKEGQQTRRKVKRMRIVPSALVLLPRPSGLISRSSSKLSNVRR
jgi:hypothetical protein